MKPFIDLSGKKFYMLHVVRLSHKDGRLRPYYHCVCDCGNKVVVRADSFTTGNTKSCGCLNNLLSIERFMKIITKHGDAKKRLYKIWKNMRDRCSLSSIGKQRGRYYADRGIGVCKEWQEYECFREWAINNNYSNEKQIARINPNGNYEPDNCRWVDFATQQRNRRHSIRLEFRGHNKHLKEWAEMIGVKYNTLFQRYQVNPDPVYVLRPYRHGNTLC